VEVIAEDSFRRCSSKRCEQASATTNGGTGMIAVPMAPLASCSARDSRISTYIDTQPNPPPPPPHPPPHQHHHSHPHPPPPPPTTPPPTPPPHPHHPPRSRPNPQHPRTPLTRARPMRGRFRAAAMRRGSLRATVRCESNHRSARGASGAATELEVERQCRYRRHQHLFEDWCARHLYSGALEARLEPWWQPLLGAFSVLSRRRLLPATLRAFVDFIRSSANHPVTCNHVPPHVD